MSAHRCPACLAPVRLAGHGRRYYVCDRCEIVVPPLDPEPAPQPALPGLRRRPGVLLVLVVLSVLSWWCLVTVAGAAWAWLP